MTENTPESDLGSIECFQNYTASEVFVQGLAGIVNQQDVESMIRAQKQMLQRFEKTNEMLINCNTLCVTRLKTASTEFKKHTSFLIEMRKDLDNIFKRIQALKTKTSILYPEAFAAAPLVKDSPEAQTSHKELQTKTKDSQPEATTSRIPDESLVVTKMKRNSSSSESGNASHDSSPYTSDTG